MNGLLSEASSLCPFSLMLRRKVSNTNVIVFDLTRPGVEPTIYRIWGEHHRCGFYLCKDYCLQLSNTTCTWKNRRDDQNWTNHRHRQDQYEDKQDNNTTPKIKEMSNTNTANKTGGQPRCSWLVNNLLFLIKHPQWYSYSSSIEVLSA